MRQLYHPVIEVNFYKKTASIRDPLYWGQRRDFWTQSVGGHTSTHSQTPRIESRTRRRGHSWVHSNLRSSCVFPECQGDY